MPTSSSSSTSHLARLQQAMKRKKMNLSSEKFQNQTKRSPQKPSSKTTKGIKRSKVKNNNNNNNGVKTSKKTITQRVAHFTKFCPPGRKKKEEPLINLFRSKSPIKRLNPFVFLRTK